MTLSEQTDATSTPGEMPLPAGHGAAITPRLPLICRLFVSAGQGQTSRIEKRSHDRKLVSPVIGATLGNDNICGYTYKADKIHAAGTTLIHD